MNALPPVTLITDHACIRARERYGLSLSAQDIGKIKAMCSRRTIVRTDSRGTVHLIVYRRIAMAPVIRGDVIVTFLPEGALYSARLKRKRHDAFVRCRGKVKGRRPA